MSQNLSSAAVVIGSLRVKIKPSKKLQEYKVTLVEGDTERVDHKG